MATTRSFVLIPCAFSLAFTGAGCAPADPTASELAAGGGEKIGIGSVAGFVERLHGDEVVASRRFALPLAAGRELRAIVEAYDEEDGRIAMMGRAADLRDSEFILKVNEAGVYGWLVDREQNLAWEYTTGSGDSVVVEAVPFTKIFPVCPVPPDDEPAPVDEPTVVFNAPAGFPAHVGTYPNNDVTKLQSRPGSTKVWYINLTDVMNGTEPKSGHTKADVWTSWAIKAATMYPFDVNVTTDPAVYAAAGATNSGCTTMIYADIGGTSSCGLNTFGTRRCCDNHLYRDGYGTGRILNHEAGHGWGLSHDGGQPGGEYYEGIPDFQWTPLMGNVWPADRWQQALITYSKGEYSGATQTQDDFAIVDRTLDYVADDIPETKPLVLAGTMVAMGSNWGQIGRNTDTDSWSFEIGASGGHATLKVDRIEHRGGSQLDVDASIVDSTGRTVVQNNAAVARHADLNVDLPAGRYTVLVKGGAEGTPQRGFSNYASVGLYAISGTLTGGISTGGTGGMGGMGGMGGTGMGGGGLAGGAGAGGAGGSNGGAGPGGAAGLGGTDSGGAPGGLGGQGGIGGAGAASGGAAGLGGTTSGTAGVSGAGLTGSGGSSASGGFAGSPGTSGNGATLPPANTTQSESDAGCGCRVPGAESKRGSALPLVAGLVVAFARRRRRR